MRKILNSVLCVFLLGINAFSYLNIKDIKYAQGSHIQNKTYTDYINVSGEFENTDTENIKLSYPVCIKELYVKENSVVNKGQCLFSIDKKKMISFLNKEFSDEDLKRIDMKDISGFSNQSFSNETIYNLPDNIYASDDGIISELNIYNGCITPANKTLLTISKSDEVMAKFTVSQLDFGKIGVGDKVDITPVAFSNVTYNGNISPSSAIIKQQLTALGSKVMIDIFADIKNIDSRVCDGLQINGKIIKQENLNIKALEHKYIYQDEKSQYVYTLDNGKANKEYIETGIETQDYIQVLSDFPEGTIFLSGNIDDNDRIILSE